MSEKKISSPNWDKISRGEYEKKRKQDLKQIEKAVPKTEPPKIGGVKQTPRDKERKQKKQIRAHIRKMHEDALTKILGLDEPEPEMCQACFQVLQGDVFVSNVAGANLYLCRKCYQSLDRCDNCSRPVKRSIKGVNKQYCEYCKSAKECTSCGKEIKPKNGKRIPGVRGFYCSDCFTSEKCFFCGVPAVKDSYKVGEGALICKECLQKGVIKTEQAKEILKQVKNSVLENFKIRTPNPVKTGVVTLDDINDVNYSNFFSVLKKDSGIFILVALGTPVEKFKGRVAYEIARDYIRTHLGRLQPEEVYHGFAKFIRYNYLKVTGYIEEAHALKKNENYKSEFQQFMKLESKLGFSKVVQTIKKGKMPLAV